MSRVRGLSIPPDRVVSAVRFTGWTEDFRRYQSFLGVNKWLSESLPLFSARKIGVGCMVERRKVVL
jgi:hypothetical protein